MLTRPGEPQPAALGAGVPTDSRRELPWRGLVTAPAVARALGRLVRETQARLIHTHDMRSNLAAYLFTRRARVPWIAHVHGWLGATHRARWRVYERIERRLVRHADLVLVGSAAALGEVEACGVRRARIVANAVHIPPDGACAMQAARVRAELGASDATVVIGTTGRLHAGKGQTFLVRAIAELRRRGRPVHGLVVGEGPDLDPLRRLARDLGVARDVTLTGFCTDPIPYVAAMDVFVAPSLKESLPLTVLEAMALRRPVVVSAVGDLPRVITDGVSGFLVPPADVTALTETLERLIPDAALRGAVGARGRAVVAERFSADSMIRALENIYADLIAAEPSPVARSAAPSLS